jgi:hypothetical protein
MEEVQAYQTRQFRSASRGSSGAPNAAVHLEHARIFIIIRFNFYHYGQFRSAGGGSTSGQNFGKFNYTNEAVQI